MKTCGQVIQRALVKLTAIDAGRAATSTEAENALEVLKSYYHSIINGGALGRAKPYRATADYTACENQRISVESTDTFTITIPGTLSGDCYSSNGWTCCGDGNDDRAPKDLAFVIVTDGTETVTFLYDAYDGRWTAVEPLELADDAPLSGRDFEGLACALAQDLADEFGAQVGALTMRRAESFRGQLSRRDGSPTEIVSHEYF